ncbi:hypothetical protein BU17DRAFT_61064 [Hysterangium stoloniferum]|nr:hypothetical protein BU17DRAFT_61064 [Hysterangium stoloniferum]
MSRNGGLATLISLLFDNHVTSLNIVSINTFLSKALGSAIFVPLINILLLLRIYALYNQSRKSMLKRRALLSFNLNPLLILVDTVWVLTLTGIVFHIDGILENPLPGLLPGCFPNSTPSFKAVIIIYLALACFPLLQFYKSGRFWATPTLKVFFRDGAAYSLSKSLVSIVGPILVTGQVWLIAVTSIFVG